MTRNTWVWIGVAVLLGGLSLYLNRDWFNKDNIQIYHRSRPARAALRRKRAADDSLVNPIVFGFDRNLKLTCIKVIPIADIQTNKYPHPIWHLVSESNSVPTKNFAYGASISGMHPAVNGSVPDLLEPGVMYRLMIEAGQLKCFHDFSPVARTP
jgi:hypothetical protein